MTTEQEHAIDALRGANDDLRRTAAELEAQRTVALFQEARLRAVVQGASDGIITFDEVGLVESFNGTAEQFFGYSADEVVGNNFSMLVSPQHDQQHEDYRGRCLELVNKKVIGTPTEVEGQRKNGETFPMQISVSEVQVFGRRLFTGIVRDLTDRKRVENELRTHSRAWSSMSNGILITDPTLPDNPIVYCNRAFTTITGYSECEALGRNARFLAGADRTQDAYLELRRAIKEERACHVVMRNYRKDGTPFWNDLTVSPVLDDDGRLTHFVGVQVDVTKQRQSEEELRLAAITFQTNDAIIITDRRTKILRVNRGFMRLTGYTAEEIIGKTPRILQSGRHDRAYYKRMWTALLDEGLWEGEIWNKRKNGEHYCERLLITAVQNTTGETTHYVGIAQDITWRKEAKDRLRRVNERLAEQSLALKHANEELQRSNQELEQFAYVSSHDLQEPLRKVSAFCTLLEQEYGDKLVGEGKTYLRYAVDGADRMKTLIQDLLAYSRVHTKGNEFMSTNIAETLARVLDHLELAIAEAKAEVTYDVLPTVMADETQLVHLLQNLIGNAIKYRGEVAPKIHIGVERQSGEWLFSVSDNGIGIAPEFHERVFGIFKRLHARDEYSGTGIGLAICERIANRLGGRIWVESEEGQGATFYFTIPAAQSVPLEGVPKNEYHEPALAETY
ncbi:MAG: PAS domain S-box protein [Planctomycetes bacterium]|nr:PAS domain S-box protein [Planctomycetota bacterium]